MKTTVVIQIGNSDDRLAQVNWSKFIKKTQKLIEWNAREIHFNGFSAPTAIWQNAAWIFTIESENSMKLWDALEDLREEFDQYSIAWTEGVTVFVEGKKAE